MSHVTTIDLFITDLDALERAAEQCGLELVRGQTTHKWFGRWVNDYSASDAAYKQGVETKDYGKCEHALRVKGNPHAYEVGVVRRTDGKPGYRLVWDFYAGGQGLTEHISYTNGKDANKLADWYSAEVSAKSMQRQGWRVSNTQEAGKVVTRCRK